MRFIYALVAVLMLSVGAVAQGTKVAVMVTGKTLVIERTDAMVIHRFLDRTAPNDPRNLAIMHALGVAHPLRTCRADELRNAELTAFIRPGHGGYCKRPLERARRDVKYAHAQQKPAAIVPPSLTIPVPAEEAAQLKALDDEAAKQFKALQDAATKLQSDYQRERELIVRHAAIRISLPVTKFDAMIVEADGKGGYHFSPRKTAEPVKPEPPKEK